MTADSAASGVRVAETGAVIEFDGEPARLLRWIRDDRGRLEVLLRIGETDRRVPYADVCASLLDVEQPQPEATGEEAEWAALPEKERARVRAEARDLLQIRDGSPRGDVDRDRAERRLDPRYDPETTTLEERIARKNAELRARNRSEGLSRATYYRKIADYERDGYWGLVRRSYRTTRDPLAGVDPEVREALEEFLTDQRGRAKVSNKRRLTLARDALAQRGLEADLSDWVLGRIVSELSRAGGFHRDARSRETHTNRPETVYGRRIAHRPGDVVQVDASRVDVHVWDADLGWITANVLTGIDVYTRCIVALRVIPGAVTSRDVGMLLWDMGRPTITRSGWPYELQYWHGIPRLVSVVADPEDDDLPFAPEVLGTKPAFVPVSIVMDHGSENDSEHLHAVAARAGIDIVMCPPRTPHAKGIVEGWHNALGEILSLLPGFKGANPGNHPREVEQEAVLTTRDLYDALWTYIFEIYHQRPHSGLADPNNLALRCSPATRFDQFLRAGGGVDIPEDPYRFLEFLSHRRVTVQGDGLHVNNRIYNSAEVLQLRGLLQQGVGQRARKVPVYYDRWDTSRVYLRHPTSGRWLVIPRATPAGVSLSPASELVTEAAIEDHITNRHQPLTPDEVSLAEARFAAAYRRGTLTTRREQRLAARERGRAEQLAHDIQDMPQDLRYLAYPETRPTQPNLTVVPDDQDQDQADDGDPFAAVRSDGLAL